MATCLCCPGPGIGLHVGSIDNRFLEGRDAVARKLLDAPRERVGSLLQGVCGQCSAIVVGGVVEQDAGRFTAIEIPDNDTTTRVRRVVINAEQSRVLSN